MKYELYKYLSQFVFEHRIEHFERVINYRTRYITVVLEDSFQAQNASAVIRSCDCFGIQDVHFIENKNKFRLDRSVTMGSHKWLSLFNYDSRSKNTIKAINHLKSRGYRIIATSPHENEISLYDLNLSKGKIALVFGTELTGLSDDAIRSADEFIKIPMFGFTESYNLSVAVSLTLQHLVSELHKMERKEWQLSEDERIEILLTWMKKSIRRVDLIEKRFHELRIK